MPMNPLDNMPEALRRQIGAGKVSCLSKQLQMNEISNFGGCATCASGGHLEKVPTPSSTLIKQGKVRYMKSESSVFLYAMIAIPFCPPTPKRMFLVLTLLFIYVKVYFSSLSLAKFDM